MRYREIALTEMPISSMSWDEGGERDTSFSQQDRKLLSSDKARTKIVKAFAKTPFDFEVFFIANNRFDGDDFSDNDDVDALAKRVRAGVHDAYGEIESKPGVIRVVMVGNLSPVNKMPMTAWTLAHKIGHTVQDSIDSTGRRLRGPASELVNDFNRLLNFIDANESNYADGFDHESPRKFEYPAWISEFLTMRSAREGKLDNAFETFAELIAQYLIAGQITMKLTNPKAQALVSDLNAAAGKIVSSLVGRVVVGI